MLPQGRVLWTVFMDKRVAVAISDAFNISTVVYIVTEMPGVALDAAACP
jgi:hypothetical protein